MFSIMRIEQGNMAVGEINGTTTAGDLGLGKMTSTKQDFISRLMAQHARDEQLLGVPALCDGAGLADCVEVNAITWVKNDFQQAIGKPDALPHD